MKSAARAAPAANTKIAASDEIHKRFTDMTCPFSNPPSFATAKRPSSSGTMAGKS
jgi:hypothetical protein